MPDSVEQRHGGPPIGSMPFKNTSSFSFPGALSPPGFTIPNQPIMDPAILEKAYRNDDGEPKIKPQEVKHLNQYQGFFTTPEGDFPVSVVADSMKEAAKILTMPGVFGDGINEPTTIKFVKGKIAVSIPVRMTGFNVVIDPVNAIDSGAYATPTHAEVRNGTEVLFTAHEPFGWKFIGWFKGEQLLSTDKVSWIEVYDPYSSLLQYTAKYEFDPVLRNGRYMELGNGFYFDFIFDTWSTYLGKMTLWSPVTPEWHFVCSNIDPVTGYFNYISDPGVKQADERGMTIDIKPTPIGINITIIASPGPDNEWGLEPTRVYALKWVGNFLPNFS